MTAARDTFPFICRLIRICSAVCICLYLCLRANSVRLFALKWAVCERSLSNMFQSKWRSTVASASTNSLHSPIVHAVSGVMNEPCHFLLATMRCNLSVQSLIQQISHCRWDFIWFCKDFANIFATRITKEAVLQQYATQNKIELRRIRRCEYNYCITFFFFFFTQNEKFCVLFAVDFVSALSGEAMANS